MPKTNFGYESKRQSRQKLINFVIRNYPKNERRDLKMVCFPGAEARDVYEVSDTLKIPRGNVWGLEVDKDIFKTLESKRLGINLVNRRDNEFFKDADERFDIVSLDYFGQLKKQEIDSLRYIFGREVLQPKAILHTNFYGSRESEKVKKIYRTGSELKAATDGLKEMSFDDISNLAKKGGLGKIVEKGVKEYMVDIKGLRDGLSRTIMTVAERGKSNMETEDMGEILKAPNEITRKLMDSGVPLYMASYVAFKQNRPYFCDSLDRYKYVSDDGSPMLTDIFLFNQHRDWFDEKEYPVKLSFSKPGTVEILIGGKVPQQIPELVYAIQDKEMLFFDHVEKKVFKQAVKVNGYSGQYRQVEIVKDRQLIGSERTVKKNTTDAQALSKADAVGLLKDGVSSEQIVQEHPGTNIHQLRAYKAWITMRKEKSETGS